MQLVVAFNFGVICYEIKNGRHFLVWLASWVLASRSTMLTVVLVSSYPRPLEDPYTVRSPLAFMATLFAPTSSLKAITGAMSSAAPTLASGWVRNLQFALQQELTSCSHWWTRNVDSRPIYQIAARGALFGNASGEGKTIRALPGATRFEKLERTSLERSATRVPLWGKIYSNILQHQCSRHPCGVGTGYRRAYCPSKHPLAYPGWHEQTSMSR